MTATFDIFQMEPEGTVRWLEAAKSLEEAKSRVQELAAHTYGGYVILDQKTGNKLLIEHRADPESESPNNDPFSRGKSAGA